MTTTLAPSLDDYALWHPMTSMPDHLAAPVTMREGRGSCLVDVDGNRYVSGNAALWNVACGFDHPKVLEAMRAQLDRLSYGTLFRFGHEPARLLAERLLECLGQERLTRIFFTTSGSGAVDATLKLARRYQRLNGRASRELVGAFDEGYHGTTYGAAALTGEDLDQETYAVDRRHVLHIPTPGRGPCPSCPPAATACTNACADAAIGALETRAQDLAAVVVEPILGSAGAVVPPDRFFAKLQAFCRSHDVLLVVDEVATGFGRTGRWFGHQWTAMEPDVVIMSKAINNGALPLGAVAVHERVWQAFHRAGAMFAHGETQAGNPVACAAGLATLEVLETERLVERAAHVGHRLRRDLEPILPAGGQVRGRGAMLGVRLPGVDDLHDVGDVVAAFLRRGVVVHPAPDGFGLFPPLTLGDDEIDHIVRAAGEVITAVVPAVAT